jgi:excisionase family DNA binding protein
MTEQLIMDWTDLPAILTSEECAVFLRVHINTVKRLLADGKLPGRKIGRQWRIDKEDLKRFMEETS